MSDLTITCERCKTQIDHRCNADLMTAIVKLYTWSPEQGMPEYIVHEAKRARYYSEGDETAPFLSEAFLYSALGKEDARTLLALVGAVIAAAGIDELGVHRAVNDRCIEIDKEREERERQRRRQQLIYKIKTAKSGLYVSEDEWPLLQHLEKLHDRFRIGVTVKRNGKQWRRYEYLHSPEA